MHTHHASRHRVPHYYTHCHIATLSHMPSCCHVTPHHRRCCCIATSPRMPSRCHITAHAIALPHHRARRCIATSLCMPLCCRISMYISPYCVPSSCHDIYVWCEMMPHHRITMSHCHSTTSPCMHHFIHASTHKDADSHRHKAYLMRALSAHQHDVY